MKAIFAALSCQKTSVTVISTDLSSQPYLLPVITIVLETGIALTCHASNVVTQVTHVHDDRYTVSVFPVYMTMLTISCDEDNYHRNKMKEMLSL